MTEQYRRPAEAHPRRPGLSPARRAVPRHHSAPGRSRRASPRRSTRSPSRFAADGVDEVVGIEARGFILAAPVALALRAGFVPVRKPGKLPGAVHEVSYDLEYGSNTLQAHEDAFRPGSRVLDRRRRAGHRWHRRGHGGTRAPLRLGGRRGDRVLMELLDLHGRDRLEGLDVRAVLALDLFGARFFVLDAELIAFLARVWGLTHVRVGVRHQTYPSRFVQRLDCDQGAFALKVDRRPGAMVAGSERVQQHVAAALPGHAPLIRAALDGELAVVEQGSRYVLQDDVGSGPPDDSPATWRRLGAIVGALHALPAIDRPFAIPVGAACDELARHADGYPFGAELQSLLPRLRQIGSSPSATLHGEVNLANAVLGSSGDVALVDWDQAGVARSPSISAIR